MFLVTVPAHAQVEQEAQQHLGRSVEDHVRSKVTWPGKKLYMFQVWPGPDTDMLRLHTSR